MVKHNQLGGFMWYAIWRNQESKVMGFIVDGHDEENNDPLPMEFICEAEAHDKLKGHILYPYIELVEL